MIRARSTAEFIMAILMYTPEEHLHFPTTKSSRMISTRLASSGLRVKLNGSSMEIFTRLKTIGLVKVTMKRWITFLIQPPLTETFIYKLNLAVGGDWPGNPDATTDWSTPKQMLVDYVRVYRYNGLYSEPGHNVPGKNL